MSDFIDDTVEQEELILAMRLATHLGAPTGEQIEQIIKQGRDCSECGLPIPAARLRAKPQAHRCIECQEYWEKRR